MLRVGYGLKLNENVSKGSGVMVRRLNSRKIFGMSVWFGIRHN